MNKFGLKVRLAAAAAAIVLVAACGGTTTVSLGGFVTGLITSGLVIKNLDGQTLAIPANASSYEFPGKIDDAGKYLVEIQTQPPRLTCYVSGGTGIATGIKIASANVFCSVNTYSLGGNVTGLTGANLQLSNGADTVIITAPVANLDGSIPAAPFTFPAVVGDGFAYGVAVLVQPTGQTCTVKKGTALMGSAAVTDVLVECK